MSSAASWHKRPGNMVSLEPSDGRSSPMGCLATGECGSGTSRSSFTPVVDFIHALTYVFNAAMAGRSFTLSWADYTEWIGQVWAGQIEPVITALMQRQAESELPTPRTRIPVHANGWPTH